MWACCWVDEAVVTGGRLGGLPCLSHVPMTQIAHYGARASLYVFGVRVSVYFIYVMECLPGVATLLGTIYDNQARASASKATRTEQQNDPLYNDVYTYDTNWMHTHTHGRLTLAIF